MIFWNTIFVCVLGPILRVFIFIFLKKIMCASAYFFIPVCKLSLTVGCTSRKDGQDTQDELQKRNLRDELEDRERRHFSSKDKSYIGKKDEGEKNNIFQPFVILQLLIVNVLNLPH